MIFKDTWKKLLLVMLGFTILMSTLACSRPKKDDTSSYPQNTPVTQNVPEKATNNRVNILLFGLDDGDPENPESPRRSDTMIVASINPENKTVTLLSIPRDSKVSIPGRRGYDKIAHAFAYGGPKLAVNTVEENFKIPIDYYVSIEWKAFIKVVDILGGVYLTVERNMNYDDPYENLSIHLQKGYQHLNGEEAGEYVRFRHDELGDIGRVQRQERFLKALTEQMLQAGTILKLPALITTISRYVETDMNAYTLAKLANTLKDLKTDSLHTQMIPGSFATIDGLSYWVPDMAETQKLTDSMTK